MFFSIVYLCVQLDRTLMQKTIHQPEVIISSSIVTLLKAGETESFQGLCRVEKQRSCLGRERERQCCQENKPQSFAEDAQLPLTPKDVSQFSISTWAFANIIWSGLH